MNKLYREEEIEFLNNYYPIYGAKFCSEKLNRSIESLRAKASRLNLKSGKQKLKEDIIFENITPDENINSKIFINSEFITKESAYFIGFFWADGYIRKDRELVIEIIKDDGENLINIFNKLGK